MSKRKKIILIIVILLLLIAGALIAYKIFFDEDETANVATTIDTIKGYDYVLEDRDTELYKEEFEILKANLESDDIDYEEYAKSIAKMYIIDLYTIDNKINKYDVGGLEFIHSKALENYQLNVEDTLYKYVEDNSDNLREQELPEVSSINLDEISETTFTISCLEEDDDTCSDEEVDAYVIYLSWDYVVDLDYDEDAVVIVVREDEKQVIVQQSSLEDYDLDEDDE